MNTFVFQPSKMKPLLFSRSESKIIFVFQVKVKTVFKTFIMNIYLVAHSVKNQSSILEGMNQMKIDDEVFNKVSLLGKFCVLARPYFHEWDKADE